MEGKAWNSGIRLSIELFSLGVMGVWGWRQAAGVWSYVLAGGIPLAAAVLWGLFAVPGDPSRSGQASLPVPGWVRLILEGIIFGAPVVMAWDLGASLTALILLALLIGHYLFDLERIRWLLDRTRR